ncbi:MAG: hypothetical protein HY052_07215 [Proteobacteria bacterium]|nr:hypothetical protein [Pseudomonadota bacterium]
MPKFKNNKRSSSPFKSDQRKDTGGSTEHQCPHFSFEQMQRNTGYSVECCQKDDRAALASKLYELSQITWATIRGSGRHGVGCEKIERPSIKAPLPLSLTEDVSILALRFNGKAPMLGYREGRIFHVLLLDWNFKAYSH